MIHSIFPLFRLFPFGFPSLEFQPRRYRPHGVGNWSGHIPFACDLIASLRPAVFVELGTHLGESYFAFCQAIAECGVTTKAFAVDTWRGDAHTGAYEDEVFREVEAYNRELYSGFSQLMRMPFDEAAKHFESDSIDLLHIDGMHTYQAVRHDFENWWPKVKAGGVVLMHDSAVRDGDFGVWKVLDEVRQSAPAMEFLHSNGLGVIRKPGAERQAGIVAVLFGDAAATKKIRRYYEICANHLEHEFWSARRQRPAEWDITTQLFWRVEGEGFTESASVRVAHTVTDERSRVTLRVPQLATLLAELRIDVTDCRAFLELHSVTLLDAEDEILREIDGALEVGELRSRGLNGMATADGTGVLVLNAPAGATLLIPLTASARERMQSGGQVVIEMSGVDAWTFASKIAATKHRWEEELRAYDRALARAQHLAASRGKELDEIRESLRAAEEKQPPKARLLLNSRGS